MTALLTDPCLQQPSHHRHAGFSLVELAVVLVIVGLLASGLMLSLGTQRESTTTLEAQRQLESIREALIGFALTNGRLPCPADASLPSTTGGGEAKKCETVGCPVPSGAPAGTPPDLMCSIETGVIPWKSLGISESDPWGNRFTYFVGSEFANDLTYKEKASGKLTKFTLDTKGQLTIRSLQGFSVALEIPAVIVSHGPYFVARGSGESENSDGDKEYISNTPTPDFDDLTTWIVPAILKSRMVSTGKLP